MASNTTKSAAPAAALTDPVEGITDLTTSINQIAANNRNANSYEIRNAIVIEENKQRVRYHNGKTELSVSAQQLLANALRHDYNHRRRLSANIVADSGSSRPANACAHHVVALRAEQAEPSRKKLFDWSIGINDADNGVFLPRWATKKFADHPNAPQHGPVHTEVYHAAVYARLRMVPKSEPETGRSRLRGIKAQLLAGAFPW
ncbi:MAG: AHH domain-containing protein [Burkholderiaceae bacterium]